MVKIKYITIYLKFNKKVIFFTFGLSCFLDDECIKSLSEQVLFSEVRCEKIFILLVSSNDLSYKI